MKKKDLMFYISRRASHLSMKISNFGGMNDPRYQDVYEYMKDFLPKKDFLKLRNMQKKLRFCIACAGEYISVSQLQQQLFVR